MTEVTADITDAQVGRLDEIMAEVDADEADYLGDVLGNVIDQTFLQLDAAERQQKTPAEEPQDDREQSARR